MTSERPKVPNAVQVTAPQKAGPSRKKRSSDNHGVGSVGLISALAGTGKENASASASASVAVTTTRWNGKDHFLPEPCRCGFEECMENLEAKIRVDQAIANAEPDEKSKLVELTAPEGICR